MSAQKERDEEKEGDEEAVVDKQVVLQQILDLLQPGETVLKVGLQGWGCMGEAAGVGLQGWG